METIRPFLGSIKATPQVEPTPMGAVGALILEFDCTLIFKQIEMVESALAPTPTTNLVRKHPIPGRSGPPL